MCNTFLLNVDFVLEVTQNQVNIFRSDSPVFALRLSEKKALFLEVGELICAC